MTTDITYALSFESRTPEDFAKLLHELEKAARTSFVEYRFGSVRLECKIVDLEPVESSRRRHEQDLWDAANAPFYPYRTTAMLFPELLKTGEPKR